MTGNPIKEWIIFSALWLLLLIPVLRLTRGREHPGSTPAALAPDSVRTVTAAAVIRYTGQPVFFRIRQGAKILCEVQSPPAGGTERQLQLQIEADSAELYLQGQWPDQAKHVFEIELLVEGLPERKSHCWLRQELDEVMSFDWP